jgi:large subunit ribosomal protein L23
MALFGSKKDKDNKKQTSKKEENVLDMVKEDGKSREAGSGSAGKEVKLKEDTGRAHHILQNYHLSEKSNLLSTTSRYVFRVSPKANKLEVKKAIEKVYDVHVTAVNIVRTPGKSRRVGQTTGRTSDWKKAYVTLKEGEKISGLAEGV